MAGIHMPQRPKSNNGSILSLAGAGAGFAMGGPVGAGLGMQAGGMIGAASQPPPAPEPAQTAMTRRMGQLDQSPLRQIRNSIDSLQYVQDDAQRAELAKPLLMADYMARKNGQYGG